MSLTKPISNKELVDGVVYFTFNKQRYRMQAFCESLAYRESDNLTTVRWDKDKQMHVITTNEDFGGCGKDACKSVVTPFGSWLTRYAEKV
jgi:hypothetical protein